MLSNTTVLAVAFAVSGLGMSTVVRADGSDPCTTTSFKISKVDKACKTGGRPAAKKLMKDAVKKAKAAGESINCKTCHEDLKSFALKGDAVANLKKWL